MELMDRLVYVGECIFVVIMLAYISINSTLTINGTILKIDSPEWMNTTLSVLGLIGASILTIYYGYRAIMAIKQIITKNEHSKET